MLLTYTMTTKKSMIVGTRYNTTFRKGNKTKRKENATSRRHHVNISHDVVCIPWDAGSSDMASRSKCDVAIFPGDQGHEEKPSQEKYSSTLCYFCCCCCLWWHCRNQFIEKFKKKDDAVPSPALHRLW